MQLFIYWLYQFFFLLFFLANKSNEMGEGREEGRGKAGGGREGREGGRKEGRIRLVICFPGKEKKPSNRLLLRSLLHGSRFWYPLFLFLFDYPDVRFSPPVSVGDLKFLSCSCVCAPLYLHFRGEESKAKSTTPHKADWTWIRLREPFYSPISESESEGEGE